jgi:hypothetical protein
MGARFIGVDREQVFLMPPSVRDWVPDGRLVWTVLDAVGELDLSAFYAAYRADGHGRHHIGIPEADRGELALGARTISRGGFADAPSTEVPA